MPVSGLESKDKISKHILLSTFRHQLVYCDPISYKNTKMISLMFKERKGIKERNKKEKETQKERR
jgi:hypothetical protein